MYLNTVVEKLSGALEEVALSTGHERAHRGGVSKPSQYVYLGHQEGSSHLMKAPTETENVGRRKGLLCE